MYETIKPLHIYILPKLLQFVIPYKYRNSDLTTEPSYKHVCVSLLTLASPGTYTYIVSHKHDFCDPAYSNLCWEQLSFIATWHME